MLNSRLRIKNRHRFQFDVQTKANPPPAGVRARLIADTFLTPLGATCALMAKVKIRTSVGGLEMRSVPGVLQNKIGPRVKHLPPA